MNEFADDSLSIIIITSTCIRVTPTVLKKAAAPKNSRSRCQRNRD